MIVMSRSTGQYRKAQVSVEFMLLFMLFLVAVAAAMAVSMNRSHAIAQAQVDLASNNVLGSAADKINTAFLEGHGFSTNITLPERILRMDYTVTLSSNEVILRIGDNTYIRNLLTPNVSGSFMKGTNMVLNRDGEIIVSEAS